MAINASHLRTEEEALVEVLVEVLVVIDQSRFPENENEFTIPTFCDIHAEQDNGEHVLFSAFLGRWPKRR
jgi:hypothetical protein